MSARLVRLATAVLTSEKGRKTVGWVLAAILSPVILLVAFLCCVGSGTAEHNSAVVSAAFYGTELSESVPTEYRMQLTQMRGSFSHLDAAVAEVNQKAEGNRLDPIQVKSVFFVLCFGEDALSQADAEAFAACFYETETRVREETDETYEVVVPLPMEEVYCHDSPSVDEQQLQQAILRAINSVMSDKPTLVQQVTENLQEVIHPSRSGELTIAEVDHQLETLAREFDAAFATAATGNAADYSERFKIILTQQTKLKVKRVELERQQAEDTELNSHMKEAADIMGQAGTAITEWNEYHIRALVASVRILSKEEILVRLKSGIEIIEKLQKSK